MFTPYAKEVKGMLETWQIWTIAAMVALGTMFTRFISFIIFPEDKKPPQVVEYLSGVLTPAMMGLLVVFCLRKTPVLTGNHGIPELIAIIAIVILHKVKDNYLLSILGGTAVYMLLLKFM